MIDNLIQFRIFFLFFVIRTAFTFPMVVPAVVIILLWKWILAGDNGVLNANDKSRVSKCLNIIFKSDKLIYIGTIPVEK